MYTDQVPLYKSDKQQMKPQMQKTFAIKPVKK